MFNTLSQGFVSIFNKLRSHSELRKEHLSNLLEEIKDNLINADVSLEFVKDYIFEVNKKILEQKLLELNSVEENLSKILYDQMVDFLSCKDLNSHLVLSPQKVNNILLVGIQGSGKTTASAKLALKLKKENKKVLLVSLDIYRPAAQKQLKILADSINIDSLPIVQNEKVIDIAKRAIQVSNQEFYDVVIYDTAGRLHVDQDMIEESIELKEFLAPKETILVIDSMMGQKSVEISEVFNQKLDISSLIISRIDGDAKGGAALSVTYAIKKPVKFFSSGEHLEDFENFEPKRIVSRVLGMGDLETLVEKISELTDKKSVETKKSRIKSGTFDFNDFLSEIQMVGKMGGMSKMLNMLPNIGSSLPKINSIDQSSFKMYKSIILSMTQKERSIPEILNLSRKKRISLGSGTSIRDVEKLIIKFNKMKNLLKKMSKIKGNMF